MSRNVIYILNVFLFLTSAAFSEQKEIEVSSFYAKVYVAPSTNANFIGLIQKGERYPIIAIRDNWYNIRFKNVNGWISFSQAKIIDPYAVAETGTADSAVTRTVAAAGSETDSTAVAPVSARPDTVQYSQSPAGTPAVQRQEPKSAGTSVSAPRVASRSAPTQQHSTSVNRNTEKKESRIRSWFSQQNPPELPPVINLNSDQSQQTLFFQVKIPSPVRKFLDPSAPILGMSKRGQMLQLIGEGDMWCKVAFSDTIGWIEKKRGRVIDPNTAPPLDIAKILLIAGIVLTLLALAIFFIVRFRRTAAALAEAGSVKKNILIISKSPKTIQYSLTNGTTSLEHCFTEVGFSVSFAKNSSALKAGMQQNKPDIIMIDYQFDSAIVAAVDRLCASLEISDTVMTIVYNVPDSLMSSDTSSQKIKYLGSTFSDRDIFKLITPLLHTKENVQKSVQSSALAGNIGDGNLVEVLQFIEIGSKTGCLLVELDKPFAIICFKNGRINFAATADKITGRDAIFKVLELKKGNFRFVIDKKPKNSNVNLSTLEVLMEWTKTIDEAHGH